MIKRAISSPIVSAVRRAIGENNIAPPPVVGDWIMATGYWNDAGVWDDSANWVD